MRTAIDVIRRAQHDSMMDAHSVIIGYVDRLAKNGIREQPMTAFKWEDLAALDDRVDLAVPQHRIAYIKYAGIEGVVWDKANRIDRIRQLMTAQELQPSKSFCFCFIIFSNLQFQLARALAQGQSCRLL